MYIGLFIFYIALFVGWVLNIVQIVGLDVLVWDGDGELVVKAIGIIFFPLGSVMGYIGLF